MLFLMLLSWLVVATTAFNCSELPADLVREIASYDWLFRNVSDLILRGPLKGVTYQKLAHFVDWFGPRFTGTQQLEDSIDFMLNFLNQSGLENVHSESVSVPIWTRGNESLFLLEPRFERLALLGLGSSVATPLEGITADVIVVRSFQELDAKAAQVSGKIVVFNQPYESYGQSAQYRSQGASRAARHGALAALIRSAASHSIYSPHTGWQSYADPQRRIPAACITVEDAQLFQRLTDQGITVRVKLVMEAQNFPQGTSRNTVAEWLGRQNPEQVVLVSGHLDSWDVGQGAMDDGGGAFISLMVPYVIKDLGLRSRRTVRSVLWTAEEVGLVGSLAYSRTHADQLSQLDIVLESDEGTFDPTGLTFSGSEEAVCIMREVMQLSRPLNASRLRTPDSGSDTSVFAQLGVPAASLTVDAAGDYFAYHHSNGDTMTVEDADQLDRCLVVWTVTAYVIADLSIMLPRQNSTNHIN